jgi:hypothetical protein
MPAISPSSAVTRRSASTCRWATPTILLAAPFWFEAEACPWSCLRNGKPRPLPTTEACRACPRWEARPAPAAAQPGYLRYVTSAR